MSSGDHHRLIPTRWKYDCPSKWTVRGLGPCPGRGFSVNLSPEALAVQGPDME